MSLAGLAAGKVKYYIFSACLYQQSCEKHKKQPLLRRYEE